VENCSEGHQNDGDDICERCGADLLWPLNPTTETRPVPGYLTGECADCRTVTKLHELEPLTRPLEPGDTVPDGACPECGAEVFELRPGEEPTETRPTLNDALGACMVLIAKQPDTSHRLVSPDLQALRDISEAIARAMDECEAQS